MGTHSSLILVGGMAAVTYATRLPFVALYRRRVRLPRFLDLGLKYIPAAAFAAIVAPGVLAPGGRSVSFHASNYYLYAAVAAALAALRTRNMALTIVAGCGAAALLKALGPL
jgi:branched-subunit amino acid transport protein